MFLPGKTSGVQSAGRAGVRVDTCAYAGWTVPPYYDSMIAKLIVHAPTRDEAIARMKRALYEFTIEGIKTTIPFFLRIFSHPDFIKGTFNTAFVERVMNAERQSEKKNGNGS